MSSVPPSKPPSPPRLHPTDLPEEDAPPDPAVENAIIDENTDIAKLSNAQLIELQQNMLNDATDFTRPLINKVVPISELRAEYERGSPAFVQQIDQLRDRGFTAIRRTRGDGDCFYRSISLAFVERLLQSTDLEMDVASQLSALESTLPYLEAAGFEKLVYEDFYETLTNLIARVVQPDASGQKLTEATLLEAFQRPEESNSIVVYMRLLTSAQIQADPDDFAPFLFEPETMEPLPVRDFCEKFVEASGREADHVQMTALSRALRLNVDVAYLDGRSTKVDFVEFRHAVNSKETPIILLYRPGHYDILVRAGEIGDEDVVMSS